MLYEMEGMPSVPMDDVQEISCYVNALDSQLGTVKEITGQKRNRVFAYADYIAIGIVRAMNCPSGYKNYAIS